VTTACARRLGTAAVAGLAGVASIVGGVDAAAAQTQPNACDLLTQNDAKKILGKTVRRETNLGGTQATSCSYVVAGDAKRVVGLGVGAFATADEAANAYTRARANAQFDGLKIENVRKLGDRAYYLPKTNNFERTVSSKRLAFGEVTVLDGQVVYTAFVTPPSKSKASDAIKSAIGRSHRRPA
jgi:ribosomal protein S5